MTNEELSQARALMRGLVPALVPVADEVLDLWLEMAEDFVCKDRFGDKYVKAVSLYALHLMFLDGAFKTDDATLADYGRRVASFSLSGEFSTTYAEVGAKSESEIKNTPWGKMYWALNRKKGGGFGLVMGYRGGCR